MSFFGRFRAAFLLYGRHFTLLGGIVLSVWIPGNLAICLIERRYESADEYAALMWTSLIGAVLAPLSTAALIHALGRIRRGEPAGWRDAMAGGLRKWGALFFAQLVASFMVLAGLIALIIPGVVLLVRYAFLAPVVVLEPRGHYRPWPRSALLTLGMRWRIFWTVVLYLAGFGLLTLLLYLPADHFAFMDTLAVSVAVECVLDLAYAVLDIVLFLFYWEAVHGESPAPG